MAVEWYYEHEGVAVGPVSSAELRDLARRGVVTPSTGIMQGGHARWRTAREVMGLFPAPVATAAPQQAPAPDEPGLPPLKPAGFWRRLSTFFFPRLLSAELRTTMLADGQVDVRPVFLLDGMEVPSEMVRPEVEQRILGHAVRHSKASQLVQRQTQGKRTRLGKKRAADVLRELGDSGVRLRSRDGRREPRIERVKPDVRMALGADDALHVHSDLVSESGVVVDKPASLDAIRRDGGWFSSGDDLYEVVTTNTGLDNLLIEARPDPVFRGEDVPRFLEFFDAYRGAVGDIEKNEDLKPLSVITNAPKNRAYVDGDREAISVEPTLVYEGNGGREYVQNAADIETLEQTRAGYRRVADGWVKIRPEDLAKHREDREELTAKFGSSENVRGAAIPRLLEKLAHTTEDDWRSPWDVYFSSNIRNAHGLVDTSADTVFRLNIVESDGQSLLALDPMYNHDRFRISHAEAVAAVDSGEEWVRRQDAWVKVDTRRLHRVRAAIEDERLKPSAEGFTFSAADRESVLNVFSTLGTIEHSTAYADFIAKLTDFTRIEDEELPKSLRDGIALRPYQKHGYNWLAFLRRFGLNGILADDMGLGKTLQTLSVIERTKELSGRKLPSLVICPTSVVNNWCREVNKFFDDTAAVAYVGMPAARQRTLNVVKTLVENGFGGILVVTSYDIALRDRHRLDDFEWSYVVVDEGHNIKNPDAKRSKAVKLIHGRHKLALTGTPIQNNLDELWSLFDFAMPGYLGTRGAFRGDYGRGKKVNWDAVLNGEKSLKNRIHPFVLRRLKEAVAKDLPPKIQVRNVVELTPKQVKLYKEAIHGAEFERMVHAVEEKGVSRAGVAILAVYQKLRAICNHPALTTPAEERGKINHDDSGKLDGLKELIEEVIDGDHRTLLFSQSTQMLDIIQECYGKWGVRFLRLDGTTPVAGRQRLVDQFNGDDSIHCFLISTRAGGTGLNLTGADTVIFYDHDWNPANDNQAQDRVHRIGQTKPVTIYKLISKGTIEEKILERQELKQTMADQVIGEDVEGFKDISKEELLRLFELDEVAEA